MSFYGVTDLWAYVVSALGVIFLPGPNSLHRKPGLPPSD